MIGYDVKTYTAPIWEGDIVYYETVMFVGEEDKTTLLFNPTEIIGVYDYGLTRELKEGEDYVIDGGMIKRVKGGNAPFVPVNEYYLVEPAKFTIKVINRNEVSPENALYFNFGEKDTFTKYQIAITYKHDKNSKLAVPKCKAERLVNFTSKLKEGRRVDLKFYGDSITAGCNSSGTPYGGNTPPYADCFADMIVKNLKLRGAEVSYTNTAVGGWSCETGLNNFEERVTNETSDLLVLGFGMNDGPRALDEYREIMEKMVLKYREKNPAGEVVLIATMLPNTESNWLNNQQFQAQELYKLEQKYPFVAVADMTDMHKNLLSCGKRYRDMTGNNINHPNDFLARIYAQVLLKTILG